MSAGRIHRKTLATSCIRTLEVKRFMPFSLILLIANINEFAGRENNFTCGR